MNYVGMVNSRLLATSEFEYIDVSKAMLFSSSEVLKLFESPSSRCLYFLFGSVSDIKDESFPFTR